MKGTLIWCLHNSSLWSALLQTHLSLEQPCVQGGKLHIVCLQAKKAGAQAGWGFTKPQPSWPKPDKRAAAALVPLRSVSQ